jgi:acetyl esterase
MGRDPEYLAFARLVAAAVAERTAARPTVDEERAAQRDAMSRLRRPVVSTVEELTVDGGGGGKLPARLYRPTEGRPAPGLVFFHGGGFYLGDVEGYDPICRVLANATGVAVLSVGYRLAPEYPFPAAVEDAYAATRWTYRHAGELGFDRVGVAGDSAGANLAAVVALLAKAEGSPPLAVQVLVYGVYDLTREREPVDDPDGLQLSGGDAATVIERYLAGAEPRHPAASPMLAEDFTGLPPAVVAHAEYDPLRPEGEAYAGRLRAAGVPVVEVRGNGLDHAYLAWGDFARRAAAAIDEIGAAVRTQLNRSTA